MLYMLALLRSTPGDYRLVKGGQRGQAPGRPAGFLYSFGGHSHEVHAYVQTLRNGDQRVAYNVQHPYPSALQ